MSEPSFEFSRAITRLPAHSIVDGLRAVDTGNPDHQQMLSDHARYVATLKQAGASVTELPALEDYPDSVFVEDVALCLPELAILMRPGAASRAGLGSGAACAECVGDGIERQDRRQRAVDARLQALETTRERPTFLFESSDERGRDAQDHGLGDRAEKRKDEGDGGEEHHPGEVLRVTDLAGVAGDGRARRHHHHQREAGEQRHGNRFAPHGADRILERSAVSMTIEIDDARRWKSGRQFPTQTGHMNP